MFNVPAARLRQDFGLTLAEARLCEALVRTGSLSDAACASRIGMNTARSHLKGIFAKLGVSSQLHLLQRLAAHVREPFEGIEAE
jgi:DNA-binding CsgD family transcriptional regulator